MRPTLPSRRSSRNCPLINYLKTQLHLAHPLGYSQNAVELSIWLVLIIQLLTVVALGVLGVARRSPTFLRRLADAVGALTWAELAPPVAHQLAFSDAILDAHPPPGPPAAAMTSLPEDEPQAAA